MKRRPDFLSPRPILPHETGPSDGVLHAVKVLWGADPTHSGPVIVRGTDFARSSSIRFTLTGPSINSALPELRLPSSAGASERTWPSTIFVQGAGCFAFQLDGRAVSNVVVFAIVNP